MKIHLASRELFGPVCGCPYEVTLTRDLRTVTCRRCLATVARATLLVVK